MSLNGKWGVNMKNPLNKRFKRELKSDFGKYIAIFLFLVFFIGAMSGFMVADNSVANSYYESLEIYNVEDGHLAFNIMPSEDVLSTLEKDNDLTFYELFYKEETINEKTNLRIYKDRKDVNKICLMDGEMPKADNEIAIDRMHADNAEISVGDTIKIKNRDYIVSGLIAAPDYSCLFEKNSDMMFDAVNFSIAVMSKNGYNTIPSAHEKFNYAYKYNNPIIDDTDANTRSKALIDSLENVLKDYDKPIIQNEIDNLFDDASVYGEPLVNEIKGILLQFCDAYSLSSSRTAERLGISVDKYNTLVSKIEAIDKKADEQGITFGNDENFDIDSLSDFRKYVTDISFADLKPTDINLDDYNSSDSLDFDKEYNLILEMVDAIDESGLHNCSTICENLKGIKSVIDNAEIDDSNILSIDDYNPKYTNKAINFVIEDSKSDGATVTLMLYLIMAVIAFVFAITTSNTISKEANVIGTLRASGFSRAELIRHYMVLPTVITLVAAFVGNILGYAVFQKMFVGVYYSNYSLTQYKTLWNLDAFKTTTIVPIIMTIVINLVVLARKLRISPLNFLRGELKKKGKKRVLALPKRLPFLSKFRLRILFQNIPSYLTLFVGIVLAGAIAVFGVMFGPLLEDYGKLVEETQIANYQYVLLDQAETDNKNAEKYCLTSLETTNEKYMTDEVMVYGINTNSKYVTESIPSGKVLVSNGMMDKFGLKDGDEFTLKEPYGNEVYTFTVAGSYTYDAAISVFMNRTDYLNMFNESKDYFTGYFSNEKLTDISDDSIATVIDKDDLTKVVTQMELSMLGFMNVFKVLGILIFLLLMFILTKQVIEKNTKSISMTKILGFTDVEIGRLYLIITSFVVIASLLLAIPVIHLMLQWAFTSYIYSEMTGYIPYIVDNSCYVKMFVMGILSYAVVAFGLMFKIKKMPKGEALKNQSL